METFSGGTVQEIVSIDSENELVDTFGKPTTSVFYDHMVASSFFLMGSELLVVREDEDTAKNAGSQGTAVLIKNEDSYDSASALDAVDAWVARFPGTLGNTLKVEMADKFSSTNTSIASIALDSTDTLVTEVLQRLFRLHPILQLLLVVFRQLQLSLLMVVT